MEISDRDKRAIYSVTRYGLGGFKYVFEKARNGNIIFRMPGTTSRAYFTDQCSEEYVAALAVFAVTRLARKKEERFGLCLLEEEVLLGDRSVNIWKLIKRHTGQTKESLVASAKERKGVRNGKSKT